jgi:lipoyl-dependent peroxiredoxin
MKSVYSTKAVSVGGRDGGLVRIENSALAFNMERPIEAGKIGANPEQLFGAAYSACFESAFRGIAKAKRLDLKKVSIEVETGIGQDDKGGHSLFANIVAKVSGVDQAMADLLVQDAHKACPYSKATRGNIEVNVSAQVV